MTHADALTETLEHNLTLGISAPDFPLGVEWLNVAQPLTMKALRGKIVLLDFWTFCCINCMHVIPELKQLEASYPNELVVVGVHSAKFQNEKVTEQIRQGVLRYEVTHPVLNDAAFVLWNAYGVNSWPTLILIDAEGHVVLQTSGEGNGPRLDRAIRWLIRYHADRGTLSRTPLALRPETVGRSNSTLRFPGKIAVDEGTLFIADSNHNQIVVADREGRTLKRIGQETAGLRDGSFEEAQFHHPQGLARRGEVLYVADTENHAIREVHLAKQTVRTIAGTGRQGNVLHTQAPARTTALNSPWDLVLVDGLLYIAMAGAHQIWSLDPTRGIVDRYAGSGQEQIIDGALSQCALAQPSGISADPEGNLYLADSEVSAVRKIDRKHGRLDTLIGAGLFTFGDRDGPWKSARLQHPLGVLWHDGALYVADSYNHKIKRLNLSDKTIDTIAGTDSAGAADGSPGRLAEPAGLAADGPILYIADTNNHAIRILSLKQPRLSTLQLISQPPTTHVDHPKTTRERTPTPQAVSSLVDHTYALPICQIVGGSTSLIIDVSLPTNAHFVEGAPVKLSIVSPSGRAIIERPHRTLDPTRELPLTVPIAISGHDADELAVKATVLYCADGPSSGCQSQTVVVRQPFQISARGRSCLTIPLQLNSVCAV